MPGIALQNVVEQQFAPKPHLDALPLSFILRPAIFHGRHCTFLLTQGSLSGILLYSAGQNRAQMPIVRTHQAAL